MKKYFLSICFLLVTSVAWGVEFVVPEQKIDGLGSVPSGEVVVLSVTSLSEKPQYLETIIYNWTILENGKLKTRGVKEWPDKTSVIFGAGKVDGKIFTVLLNINYLYIVKENNTIKEVATRTRLVTGEVIVGDEPGPGPGPDPGPNPPPPVPPTPEPSLPDGEYKLAKDAYTWAMASVDASSRKGAKALANSFRGLSAAVAAGTITNVEEFLTKSKQANNSALTSAGINPTSWDSFGVSLQRKLYSMYKNKEIGPIQNYATAWNEIATGLDAVAKVSRSNKDDE